ncbi:MAG: hypothetical protein Harvfovirus1_80 [Harvfovirus sp.]|uniref:Uncharacterized protein n=1 Tax=Harvfovirus sp. TaxID=2487768 RepID=A0A3G4ZZV1_9VIRU|nr:MAG: hypothetical protein Harvfovirus1_80 [Harvfovirus sp.]
MSSKLLELIDLIQIKNHQCISQVIKTISWLDADSRIISKLFDTILSNDIEFIKFYIDNFPIRDGIHPKKRYYTMDSFRMLNLLTCHAALNGMTKNLENLFNMHEHCHPYYYWNIFTKVIQSMNPDCVRTFCKLYDSDVLIKRPDNPLPTHHQVISFRICIRSNIDEDNAIVILKILHEFFYTGLRLKITIREYFLLDAYIRKRNKIAEYLIKKYKITMRDSQTWIRNQLTTSGPNDRKFGEILNYMEISLLRGYPIALVPPIFTIVALNPNLTENYIRCYQLYKVGQELDKLNGFKHSKIILNNFLTAFTNAGFCRDLAELIMDYCYILRNNQP